MGIVRRVGCVVIAVAAAIVLVVLRPTGEHLKLQPLADRSAARAQISSNFNSNNSSASYIYGQIYATGIATKDSAALLSEQLDALDARQVEVAQALIAADNHGRDIRPQVELALLILLVAWLGATTVAPRSKGPLVAGSAMEPLSGSATPEGPETDSPPVT